MASFIENFNSLDPSLWSVADGYAEPAIIYDATWRIANASLDSVNGLLSLKITPDTAPSATRTYAAGEIKSVGAAYGFGSYSVRMKASSEPGVISAFFLSSGGAGEIDIQLGYFGDHSHGMLRCNYSTGGSAGTPQIIELGFDPTAAFHTYTLNWTASTIVWMVDGNQVAAAFGTTPIPTIPGQIFLNCWPTTGNDAFAGAYSGHPTAAVYDWLSYTASGEDLSIGAASFVSGTTSVFRNGGTLTGTAFITNYGGSSALIPAAKITSTDPSGNAIDFGLATDIYIAPGQTVPVAMSRTFFQADLPGVWQGFFAYQGDDGSWTNGNPFIFYVI